MKKIADGMYIHRGIIILRDNQGVSVENNLYLFKTFTDARIYIDMMHSEQSYAKWNGRKPVIVGKWNHEK